LNLKKRYFGECHRRAARDCAGNLNSGTNIPRKQEDYGSGVADIHPPKSEYASADIYYSKPEFEWAEDVWVNYSPWVKTDEEPGSVMGVKVNMGGSKSAVTTGATRGRGIKNQSPMT